MAKKAKADLRSIRKRLNVQIAAVERAVQQGTKAVARSRAAKRKGDVTKNQKELSKAREVLRKLKRQEVALAADCCDSVQNCPFDFV